MSDLGPQLPEYVYVVHDAAGRVLRWGIVPVEGADAILAEPNEAVILAGVIPDPAGGLFVEGGLVKPCLSIAPVVSKTNLLANGADEAEITGLPPGCEVFMHGAASMPETLVAGTGFVVTSTTPGDLHVVISKPPRYRQAVVTLRVR